MKEQTLAVQWMQNCIEAHLNEKIGLSELAEISMFSPWYSYRIFLAHTGLSPSGYIRRFQLAKAALRIKNEHIRIIDTVFNLGLGSMDGFTLAFKREFGMCPSAYEFQSRRFGITEFLRVDNPAPYNRNTCYRLCFYSVSS